MISDTKVITEAVEKMISGAETHLAAAEVAHKRDQTQIANAGKRMAEEIENWVQKMLAANDQALENIRASHKSRLDALNTRLETSTRLKERVA